MLEIREDHREEMGNTQCYITFESGPEPSPDTLARAILNRVPRNSTIAMSTGSHIGSRRNADAEKALIDHGPSPRE
jgi:hypothetical protein